MVASGGFQWWLLNMGGGRYGYPSVVVAGVGSQRCSLELTSNGGRQWWSLVVIVNIGRWYWFSVVVTRDSHQRWSRVVVL